MAELARHLRGVEPGVLHNLVRLLTGSAADFLDDYFESDILKGWLSSSGIIGTKVGPMSQGSGLVLLFHAIGEHDGHLGTWAFHKGGNGGFTQVLARAAEAFGAEIMLGAEVERVITANGRATGVALVRRDRAGGQDRRVGQPIRAARSRSSSTRGSCRRTSSTASGGTGIQGTSSKVNFALDGLPKYPSLGDRSRHVPRLHNVGADRWTIWSGPSTRRSTAGTPRSRTSTARSSRRSTRTWPRPGKHVMSCFVQYTPYELTGSDWSKEREHMATTCRTRLEGYFPGFSRPGAPARGRDPARHRAGRRTPGGQHLPR